MEPLLYMLAGGVLVLAGVFIGEKLRKSTNEQTQTAMSPEILPISEDDLRRAKELRGQWNNYMHYNGRDQKGDDEQ